MIDEGAHEAVSAHVAECHTCRVEAPALARVAAILGRDAVDLNAADLAHRALGAARPELARRAAAALRRRVAAALLVAVAPLPLLVAYGAYGLQTVHGWIAAILPSPLAAYLIFSYGALLTLLFAATYAAIPLLLSARAAPATVRA